jgi:hypothetical protein
VACPEELLDSKKRVLVCREGVLVCEKGVLVYGAAEPGARKEKAHEFMGLKDFILCECMCMNSAWK